MGSARVYKLFWIIYFSLCAKGLFQQAAENYTDTNEEYFYQSNQNYTLSGIQNFRQAYKALDNSKGDFSNDCRFFGFIPILFCEILSFLWIIYLHHLL